MKRSKKRFRNNLPNLYIRPAEICPREVTFHSCVKSDYAAYYLSYLFSFQKQKKTRKNKKTKQRKKENTMRPLHVTYLVGMIVTRML